MIIAPPASVPRAARRLRTPLLAALLLASLPALAQERIRWPVTWQTGQSFVYESESLERERVTRAAPLIYSGPSRTGAFLLGKGLGVALVALGVVSVGPQNPTARVEYALRADESLSEPQVRQVMEYYLALRMRRLSVRQTGRYAPVRPVAAVRQVPRQDEPNKKH